MQKIFRRKVQFHHYWNLFNLQLAYRNTSNKHYILSGSRDSQLRLWQFSTPNTIRIFSGHQLSITGVALFNGKSLICFDKRPFQAEMISILSNVEIQKCEKAFQIFSI